MKILNLNLWNYNNFEKRKPLIIDFIQKHNPDIITMQEVRDDLRFNLKGENQAKQINDLLKYPYLKFVKTMDVNKVNNLNNPPCFEGLAVFSKKPIIKSQKLTLKKHSEDKFTRAILWIRMKDLDIINVHYSPNDLFSKLQLEETLEFAKKKDRKPIIIGDFNIRYPSIVEEVIGEDYVSTRSIKKYISYPQAKYTLDYALVPKGINIKKFSCIGKNISDHKSLILEV
jgi:endonuclease/exonuclease/phosphatase family metal-dependent hydrolase